jgi:hypothetical protein
MKTYIVATLTTIKYDPSFWSEYKYVYKLKVHKVEAQSYRDAGAIASQRALDFFNEIENVDVQKHGKFVSASENGWIAEELSNS